MFFRWIEVFTLSAGAVRKPHLPGLGCCGEVENLASGDHIQQNRIYETRSIKHHNREIHEP